MRGEDGCEATTCLGPVFWLAQTFPPLVAKLVGGDAKQLILSQLPTETRADAETLFDHSKFPPLGTVPTNTSTIHGGTAPGEACPCTWCPKGSPGTMGCLSWERQPPLRLADGLEVLFIRNDFVVEKYLLRSILMSTWGFYPPFCDRYGPFFRVLVPVSGILGARRSERRKNGEKTSKNGREMA